MRNVCVFTVELRDIRSKTSTPISQLNITNKGEILQRLSPPTVSELRTERDDAEAYENSAILACQGRAIQEQFRNVVAEFPVKFPCQQ